ncbi:MAG: hypothetical protein WB988_14115, partial [Candidatus Nitrosopolaris sp.]
PLPSNTLNSMEAGKVQLNVFLKDSSGSKVKDVTASIINLYKIQTLHNSKEQSTEANHKTTSITISLDHEKSNASNNNNWTGEFSIPGTWLEGGTKTFQSDHSEEKKLYSLQISYKLVDGKVCTAIFDSADAFHWAV